MCSNTRWIRNRYTHDSVLVDCGRCEACQQQKADKLTARIKFAAHEALKKGCCQVFITLTYDRFSVPYVLVSDLLKYQHLGNHFQLIDCLASYDIPVYRDSYRQREFGHLNTVYKKQRLNDYVLPPSPGGNFKFKDFNKFHLHQSNGYGKIGIVYYKDLQDFEKRVASVLRRSESPFKVRWFNSSEYGETWYRPHFHLLAEIPSDRYDYFRQVVRQCWTYHNWDAPESVHRYELARDCSSYVASYVNKPDGLPGFLSDLFPAKHSFSQFMGYDGDLFSYQKVQEMVDRGDLHLPMFFDNFRGEMSYRLVPAHVVSRYYPKFKGACRLDSSSLFDVLSCPKRLVKYAKELEYTSDDLRNNMALLARCRNRCQLSSGSDDNEYARRWVLAWSVWRQTVLRDWYLNQQSGELDLVNAYDNLFDLLTWSRHDRLSAYGLSDDDVVVLPNSQSDRIEKTHYLTEKFHKKRKQKKVASQFYSDGTSDILFT